MPAVSEIASARASPRRGFAANRPHGYYFIAYSISRSARAFGTHYRPVDTFISMVPGRFSADSRRRCIAPSPIGLKSTGSPALSPLHTSKRVPTHASTASFAETRFGSLSPNLLGSSGDASRHRIDCDALRGARESTRASRRVRTRVEGFAGRSEDRTESRHLETLCSALSYPPKASTSPPERPFFPQSPFSRRFPASFSSLPVSLALIHFPPRRPRSTAPPRALSSSLSLKALYTHWQRRVRARCVCTGL